MYPTGGGTATGTTVTTGTYSSGNAAFRWALEDGGSHMGILLHDTLTGSVASSSTVRYVECGQTVSLSQLNFIASYYSDDEYAFWPYWYSSNTSVATVNSSTGQITAHALGTATITLLMTDDYNGEEFTCQYTIVVPRTLNLEVYYSNTYADIYTNGNDSAAVSRINPQIQKAQQFFLENFSIVLTCTAPQKEVSYGDHCRTSNNGSHCTCRGDVYYPTFSDIPSSSVDILTNNEVGSEEPLPDKFPCHTCYIHQLYEVIPQNPATTASIFYLGTKACNGETEIVHNNLSIRGICFIQDGVIGIFKTAELINSDILTSETITTVHEIGHLFGAPDHYGGSYPSSDDLSEQYKESGITFEEWCIYGENRHEQTPDNLQICNGCRAVINGELILSSNYDE